MSRDRQGNRFNCAAGSDDPCLTNSNISIVTSTLSASIVIHEGISCTFVPLLLFILIKPKEMRIFKSKIKVGDIVIVYGIRFKEIRNSYEGIVTKVTNKSYSVQTETDGELEVPRIQIERINKPDIKEIE